MDKSELKDLVKKYFNLTEANNNQDNVEEVKEVSFAEATLADGTKITNMVEGDFEVGQELHVITEEGEHVIAPSGEHTTESGIVITVDGEGKITGVKYPDEEGEGSLETEEEAPAEAPVEEEMSSEEITEMAEEGEEVIEEEIVAEESMEDEAVEESPIEDIIADAIAEIVAPQLEELKTKMAEIEEAMKEHYSKTPATVSTTESRFSKIQEYKSNKKEGTLSKFDAKQAQKDLILKALKKK